MKKVPLIINDDLTLPGYSWQNTEIEKSKGIIIFLHGFTNQAQNSTYLGEWFAEQGYFLLAYDHRDHGSSPRRNEQCTLDDLSNDVCTIIQTYKDKYPDTPLHLIGSSMGGGLAILASQKLIKEKGADYIDGLILFAPQVTSTNNQRKFTFSALSALSKIVPKLKIPIGIVSSALRHKQCDNPAFCTQLNNDPLMLGNPSLGMLFRVVQLGNLAGQANFDEDFKVLVLYAGDDVLVPAKEIENFISRIEKSKTKITSHLYPTNRHILWGDMNREEIFQDIVEWIA